MKRFVTDILDEEEIKQAVAEYMGGIEKDYVQPRNIVNKEAIKEAVAEYIGNISTKQVELMETGTGMVAMAQYMCTVEQAVYCKGENVDD